MKAGLATTLSLVGVLATGGAALVLNSSILDTESSAKGSPAFATVVGLESEGVVTPLGGGAPSGPANELSANSVAGAIGAALDEPSNVTDSATPLVVANASSATGDSSTGPSSTTAQSKDTASVKQKGAGITATDSTAVDPPSPTSSVVAPAPTTSVATPSPSTTMVPPPPPTTVAPPTEKQFRVGDAATITLVVNGKRLLVKDIAITPGSGYKVTNQFSNDGDDVRITLTSPTRAIEFSARLVNGQIMAAVSTPSSGNLNPPRPRHEDDDDDHDDDRRPRHGDDDDDDHHDDGHDDDDD